MVLVTKVAFFFFEQIKMNYYELDVYSSCMEDLQTLQVTILKIYCHKC